MPKTRSRFCARCRARAAIAAEIEVLAHAHVGKDAAAFRHVDQAARHDRGRARALDRRAAAKRIAPRHGRSTPEIARLSVDLPTPFEPSTATISPSFTARSMPRRISVAP